MWRIYILCYPQKVKSNHGLKIITIFFLRILLWHVPIIQILVTDMISTSFFFRISFCLSPFHCFFPFSLSPFHKTFPLRFFFSLYYVLFRNSLFCFPFLLFIYVLVFFLLVGIYISYFVSHRIFSGTEERFEEEGVTEGNYHELTTIPSSSTTWFLAENANTRPVAPARWEDRRLEWRTEDETGKKGKNRKRLNVCLSVFHYPTL